METNVKKTMTEDVNFLLIRLERSYQDILLFKSKMSSYKYEPYTQQLHELHDLLLRNIGTMSSMHLEVLKNIRSNRDRLSYDLVKMGEDLIAATDLEKSFSTYMMELQR